MAVPFKAEELIKVERTVFKVIDVVSTSVEGIHLVDLLKVKDGSLWFARWSEDVNSFLFVAKKRSDDGPTRLRALFEIKGE